MKSPNPQTVWRFNYRDKKIDCDFDDIFATPPREVQEVPDDWLNKINTPTVHVYGGNSQKGKADHLRAWQYKKSDGQSTVSAGEGNRRGPQLQDQRRLLPDGPSDPYGNTFPYGLDGSFDWAEYEYNPTLMHPDDNFNLMGGHGDERLVAAERALASVNEDPNYDRSHLGTEIGLTQYDPIFDPDVVNQITGEVFKPELLKNSKIAKELGLVTEDPLAFEGDDRFEEIQNEHGKDVAEVFCLIDDSMPYLNGKDELVEQLMSDMIHMMSEEGQEQLFKRLYQELPDKAQERIQMNGIH